MCEDPEARYQSRNNLAVEVLQKTGALRLSAFGYSMLPTLYPGDILDIRREALSAIQPGDVVLYAREGRFFIHRNLCAVSTRSQTALVTRGDAMPHADEPVLPEELLGKVVSLERGAETRVVPPCTSWRRAVGLALAYSGRLRSLVLRWHKPQGSAGPELAVTEVLRQQSLK
jgi:signal peptidase I